MSETQPIKYVAYPRENSISRYGTPEKLEALGAGHAGLVQCVLVSIAMEAMFSLLRQYAGIYNLIVTSEILFVVISLLAYFACKKIAVGMGWPKPQVILAALFMGITGFACYGVVGYCILEKIVSRELKRYGVRAGLFGIRKGDIQAALDVRRNTESFSLPLQNE